MTGHHARSESLFYYFRLEDQVPENHLLRLIDKHISFEFVRQQLKDSYSATDQTLRFALTQSGLPSVAVSVRDTLEGKRLRLLTV